MKNKQLTQEEFLEALYDEMYDKLRSFLQYYSYDKQLIEDILQETFLEAYRHADELMKNDHYRSWLYSTATNKSKKLNHNNQKYNDCVPLDESLEIAAAEEICEYERFAEIRAELVGDEYELLMMHFRDNYTYEEIGKIHHKSSGYMKVKINRIVKRLKKKLTGE